MCWFKLFKRKNQINIEKDLKTECELINKLMDGLQNKSADEKEKINLAADIELAYSKVNNSINNYFNQKQSLPFYWQDLFSINYRLKNIFDSIIGCTHINQFGPKLLKLFNIETEIIKNFICFLEEYLKNIKYSREI